MEIIIGEVQANNDPESKESVVASHHDRPLYIVKDGGKGKNIRLGKLREACDLNRPGQPFSFPLGAGMVIQGWDQGIVGMKVGEKVKLTIPAELGYGAMGYPPVIPANATLIFEVELLAID